ncbi:MAG: serine/threonine-protein phosphatase [Oscillospiraceae bacterium]|jgi:protein phosphatase|nr:serine/threonine-protein phosphatase [Oscillospiraceae bacterium]
MDYRIDFTIICDRGKARAKNQDNFWCGGKYLESENNGLKEPLSASTTNKNTAALAVFDGIGGEKHGELAAYIAAKTFNDIYYNTEVGNAEQFLSQICLVMNEAICKYVKEKRTGNMGTTLAALLFKEDSIFSCNLGDSKIFRFNSGVLKQVSYDHVLDTSTNKKPQLSQCLGIPEDDFIIEPYITKIKYVDNDKYIICSDGLTDMVSEDEIRYILLKQEPVLKCCKELMDVALARGGNDNITIIVCEIKEIS